jgi:hypothetical protein
MNKLYFLLILFLLILTCEKSYNVEYPSIEILTPTQDDKVIVWCVDITSGTTDIHDKVSMVSDLLTYVTIREDKDIFLNNVVTHEVIKEITDLTQVKNIKLGGCL